MLEFIPGNVHDAALNTRCEVLEERQGVKRKTPSACWAAWVSNFQRALVAKHRDIDSRFTLSKLAVLETWAANDMKVYDLGKRLLLSKHRR